MKVCYLINQYPKISHTFIRTEILALERLGAQVLRVSVRDANESILNEIDTQEHGKTHFIINGTRVGLLQTFARLFFKNLPSIVTLLPLWLSLARRANSSYLKHFFYLLEACWLSDFCKKHDVEHLHAHFGTNPATLALLCHKLGGPSYSFTVHGPEEFDSPVALSIREKIHHAKFVVAITSYCRSQLSRWSDFSDWSKIIEVHCAVDQAILAAEPKASAAPKQLVSIGRLCEQKGQFLLLQAIKELKVLHPDVMLNLVGDGEFRQIIEHYIREHQLESNVTLMGWQSGSAIAEALDAASIMVLPSFAEGLPVVIMESFARKTPVLTTYIAGIPELVNDENGWLIPAGNVCAIVDVLDAVMSGDSSTIEQKGNAGYQSVIERHDADTEAKKLFAAMMEKLC